VFDQLLEERAFDKKLSEGGRVADNKMFPELLYLGLGDL
jgi:hypothetical protein